MSLKLMIFVAVYTSSFIHQHNTFFKVMLVCAFQAALFVLADFNHVIKLEVLVALYDATIFLEQLA